MSYIQIIDGKVVTDFNEEGSRIAWWAEQDVLNKSATWAAYIDWSPSANKASRIGKPFKLRTIDQDNPTDKAYRQIDESHRVEWVLATSEEECWEKFRIMSWYCINRRKGVLVQEMLTLGINSGEFVRKHLGEVVVGGVKR